MALMGLGLFLMALGLPNERYFRSMDRLWQLAGSGPPPQGVLTLPIYALHGMGLSLEAAVFLVNALLYGASLWALQRMLRVVGFAWNLAWVSSLVALTCPVAWLGATLPTDYAAGVLGAALLATELFQTKQNKAFGYLWRVSIWLVVAFLLQAQNLWLVLPAAWAVHRQAPSRDQAALRVAGLTGVWGVCMWVVFASQPEGWHALREAAFGAGFGSSSGGAHAAFWILGLGALWFGFYSLVAGGRDPEESPPPLWCWVWMAVGLIPLWSGGNSQGPMGGLLLPMAALGLADALQRRVAPQQLVKATLALVMAHALLITVFTISLQRDDPQRAWQRVARQSLSSGDVFVTGQPERAYLSAFRMGLGTCQIDGLGGVVHAWSPTGVTGTRLIFDAWDSPAAPDPLHWPGWLLQGAELSGAALQTPLELHPSGLRSTGP